MDSSKLTDRGGLVYYNKSDTPFSGKGIKYWPTGEIQIKATFKAGILIQSLYLGMDGSLLESTEVVEDTTILIEWFANGEKRMESKTVLGSDWVDGATLPEHPHEHDKRGPFYPHTRASNHPHGKHIFLIPGVFP